MTETRGGNEQRRLHFITPHALDQLRQHLSNNLRGVGDEAAETPPHGIETTDDPVAFKLRQTINRHLRVSILHDSRRVPAARAVEQILRFDLAWNLAQGYIAADDVRIVRLHAVDVRAGGRDEREIHHRQRTPGRSERRTLVFDERIIVADLAARAAARSPLL